MAGARARATRHLLAGGDHMVHQGQWWRATRQPAVGGRLVSLQSYFGMSSNVSEPLAAPAAGLAVPQPVQGPVGTAARDARRVLVHSYIRTCLPLMMPPASCSPQ